MKPSMWASGLVLVIMAVGAVSVAPVSAEPPVTPTASGVTQKIGVRPVSVPANYAITPDGYFDPRCIYQVGENQVLVPAGNGMALVTLPTSAVARARSLTMQRSAWARQESAYTLTDQQIAAAPKVQGLFKVG